jgi:hypothetical protein
MQRICIKLTDGSSVECDFAEQIRSDDHKLTFIDAAHKPESVKSYPLVNILRWEIRDKQDRRPWQ